MHENLNIILLPLVYKIFEKKYAWKEINVLFDPFFEIKDEKLYHPVLKTIFVHVDPIYFWLGDAIVLGYNHVVP